MRVLLVQSDYGSEHLTFPLGLCYIATALKKHNHEVTIHDTNISTDSTAQLRKLIRNLEPEIIGVGLRNLDNASYGIYRSYFEPFLDLVSMLKEAAPTSKIIAGGAGFSIYARQLLERVPAIDYGILLEGEESVPELLDKLDQPQSVKGIFYRHNGSIHFTGDREPVDFANLPALQWDMVDITPYLKRPFTVGIQTKRGCAFKCAYCTYPFLQGARLRLRPAHDVLNELERLVKDYGLKSFWFVDSIFNVPQSHARDICDEMLARGLNMRWNGYYNEKFIDREFVEMARDAGCRRFEFSADGVSRSTLVALNKNLSEQDIHMSYSLTKQIDNVRVAFNFFINCPGESLGNLFRLFFFIARVKLILRRKVANISASLIRIYPHTSIHALAVEKGMLEEEDDILEPVFYNPPPLRYVVIMIKPLRRLVLAVQSAVSWLVLNRKWLANGMPSFSAVTPREEGEL